MIKPRKKFIILSMRRSGSNNLSYLLHSHPDVLSMGEMFCVEKIWGEPGKKWLNKNRFLKLVRDMFPMFFLRFFVFNELLDRKDVSGFRFFYEHGDRFPEVSAFLSKIPDLKIVHLKRENMFENLVSYELAKKTGAWSVLRNKKYGDQRIFISYKDCLQHFKSTVESYKKYQKIFKKQQILNVAYEEYCQNPDLTINNILSFLGLKSIKLNSPLQKQNERLISEIVINYSDLKNKFKKTRWAKFFK